MAISAADVKALRDKTGLGMMECKEALTEADGDVEKAVQELRKKGLTKMDGRTDRTSAEGRVCALVSSDGSKGVIVEVDTETDFTAKNDKFTTMLQNIAKLALEGEAGEVVKTDPMQAEIDEVRLTTGENVQFAGGSVLGGGGTKIGSYVHFTGKVGVIVEVEGEASDELLKDLCMHISAVSPSPLGVNPEDVPADLVEKEREIAKAQAIESGKPENIAEKMVEGKIRKYFEEVALVKQPFVKDDKQRIEQILPKGTTIKAFVRLQVGGA